MISNSCDEFITQSEAARLRKISRQAINVLVKKGRLKLNNEGKLNKLDVINLVRGKSGAPLKTKKPN